jgi:hypothetical protein
MPYNPDMNQFKSLAEIGCLKGVVGHIDGELVSVYLCLVLPHIFSKDVIMGGECLWNIRKDHRSLATLNELLDEIDNLHNKYDVKVSQICMHHNRAEKLMAKRGYALNEYWYFKENK